VEEKDGLGNILEKGEEMTCEICRTVDGIVKSETGVYKNLCYKCEIAVLSCKDKDFDSQVICYKCGNEKTKQKKCICEI